MKYLDITMTSDIAPKLTAKVYKDAEFPFVIMKVTDTNNPILAPISIQYPIEHADRIVEAVAAFNSVICRAELVEAAE